MNIEEQRKSFEGFYKTKILTKDYEIEMIDQLTEFHAETGLYEYARMQTAWESWLASANRKGFKLVPVEPTKEMYLAGTHELTQIDFRDLHDSDSVAVYKAMIGACDD